MDFQADLADFYADFGSDVSRGVSLPPFRGLLDYAGLRFDTVSACTHTLQYPASIVLRVDDMVTIKGAAYKVTAPPLPVEGDGAEWSAELVRV